MEISKVDLLNIYPHKLISTYDSNLMRIHDVLYKDIQRPDPAPRPEIVTPNSTLAREAREVIRAMTISKVSCLVVLGCLISGMSLAEVSGKDAYVQAYSKHMYNNAYIFTKGLIADGMPPDEAEKRTEAFVSGAIDCHVKYLDDYPESIQQAMYDAVGNGGSYPDAESALKLVVAEAHFAGNEPLVQKFAEVTKTGVQCIHNLIPK